MKRILAIAAALLLCIGASAQDSFGRGKVPPFSFEYGGVPSSKLLPWWKYSREGTIHRWTDPRTGLQVECQVTSFSDFGATEWVLRFRNTSSSDTPAISRVRTVDLTQSASGECTLCYADGPYFGRSDFQSRDTLLTVGSAVHLEPFGGRSSSHTMPYFNVQTPSGGVVYAIGWTGSWRADITRTKGGVRVEAGLRDFDSYLRPGEEVRVASVAMVPWTGSDRMDGQNKLRRFILKHHSPSGAGPLFLDNFDHNGPWPCDEYSCMTDYMASAVIRQYDFLGTCADGFWLDAGWYSRASDWHRGYWWHSAVGNWTPDQERFPDGLGPVADEAHRTGGKFLLWYEPERANVDSDWAREHPEWMLSESGAPAVPLKMPSDTTFKEPVMTAPHDSSFLVDMGNQEALEWVCQEMLKSLTDNKVDIYRQDFNIDPEKFWLNNDEPGRRGMTEVKYICGVYAYLDFLHAQLPHLLIDNCAGGGRRLDLEMLSRSVSLWRSDYTLDAEGRQCHGYYLNQWIPFHGTNTGSTDPYVSRSSLGTSCCFCWGITGKGNGRIEAELSTMAEFRELGPYFLEDFYPLSGYGDVTGDDIWLAYQLWRPSDSTGYVVAFRRKESPEAERRLVLHGLDQSGKYALISDGHESLASGQELMTEGLAVCLPEAGSSQLIHIKRLE